MCRNHSTTFWIIIALIFGLLPLAGAQAMPAAAPGAPRPLAWQRASSLPQSAADGVAFVLGDALYHAGGWTGQAAQPIKALYRSRLTTGRPGDWEPASELLDTGRFGAAGVTYAGRGYLIGGYGGAASLSRIDSFDGAAWRAERALQQPLNFPAAAVVAARLYVAGGISAAGVSNQVSSAPFTANDNGDWRIGDWRDEAPLPVGLITRLVYWERCLYAVGGKDNSGQWRNQIYRAEWGANDTITNWPAVAGLRQPLALHQAIIRAGVLYVLGGETTGGDYSDKVYTATIGPDCNLSEWTEEPMPNGQARRRFAAAANNPGGYPGIYVIGGQLAESYYSDETWYDAPQPTPTPTSTATPTATPTATRALPPRLDVRFSNDPVGPVQPGGLITYTIRYENTGGEDLTGVVITGSIPANTDLKPDGGATRVGDKLRWEIGPVAKGAGGVRAYTVQKKGAAAYGAVMRVPQPTTPPAPPLRPTATPTATPTPKGDSSQ